MGIVVKTEPALQVRFAFELGVDRDLNRVPSLGLQQPEAPLTHPVAAPVPVPEVAQSSEAITGGSAKPIKDSPWQVSGYVVCGPDALGSPYLRTDATGVLRASRIRHES